MKVAFIGKLRNCHLHQAHAGPPRITITHYVFQMITFNNTGTYRKEQEAISLEKIKKMRGSPVGWVILCNRLLPAVVGTTTWERKVAVQKITEFTTVSDVAFCLLALENNWDYWVKMASIEDDSNTHNTYPTTKWTSSPVLSGKNTGWSKEGLERYNELCQEEATDRVVNSAVDFDFLLKKQQENNARHKQKKTVNSSSVKTYTDEHSLCY
jgi:hypothetical protein